MEHQEIEVRFLEIDKENLLRRLHELEAQDFGEDLLEEIIIYDKALTWRDNPNWKKIGGKVLRLRTRGGKTTMTYKHHKEHVANGTEEIEFEVSDVRKAEALLSRLGFAAYRRQQKKRHTFHLGDVVVDIDTWPKIPTYVELEGPSEEHLKEASATLGLDWSEVVFENPRVVIETRYNIPVGTMKWFTFDKFE